MIEIVVAEDDAPERLDKLIARHLRVSVMEARRLIERGKVRTSTGARAKGVVLPAGARVLIDATPVHEGQRRVGASYAPVAEDGELRVLHLDEALVVVDKPAGLPTHPLEPEERGTVANRLARVHPECAQASTDPRDGGFVHRLDAPTSGVLVAARTLLAYETLRSAFAAHQVEKAYWALVEGVVDEPVTIDAPLVTRAGRARVDEQDGLEALTVVHPLARGPAHTLVEATTRTGRLHQIRAHLAHVGHPLVGDALYGGSLSHAQEPQLHARSITLPHHGSYTADLPRERRDLAERLLGKML